MTLALITYRNGPEDMEAETSAMFFYVGGIAAITLVVNATTSNALLVKLKLLGNDSAEKAIVMASIQKKLLRHMHKALQDGMEITIMDSAAYQRYAKRRRSEAQDG